MSIEFWILLLLIVGLLVTVMVTQSVVTKIYAKQKPMYNIIHREQKYKKKYRALKKDYDALVELNKSMSDEIGLTNTLLDLPLDASESTAPRSRKCKSCKYYMYDKAIKLSFCILDPFGPPFHVVPHADACDEYSKR